jgi:peptidyl-prolyl cis-trans isomerase C
MHIRWSGWRRGEASVALTIALLLAADDSASSQPTAAADPAPNAKSDPQEAARRALVVARFDSGRVTVAEIEDAIVAQNPFMQERYLASASIQALVDRSVRFELLAAEAKRRGYGENSAVEFAVRQDAVQTFIKREFDEKITPASVPAADVAQYYAAHESEFVHPETRRASMLLLANESQANAVLPLARSGDLRSFRELVRLKSVDPTNKLRGGDLRYFEASGKPADGADGAIDADVAKAAFALKNVGDVSAPLKVGENYGIVKLTGQRPGTNETLAQADERVRTRLWRERRQAAIDAAVDTLRNQLHAEVHPELVDTVKIDDTALALPPNQGLPNAFPHTRPGPMLIPHAAPKSDTRP